MCIIIPQFRNKLWRVHSDTSIDRYIFKDSVVVVLGRTAVRHNSRSDKSSDNPLYTVTKFLVRIGLCKIQSIPLRSQPSVDTLYGDQMCNVRQDTYRCAVNR